MGPACYVGYQIEQMIGLAACEMAEKSLCYRHLYAPLACKRQGREWRKKANHRSHQWSSSNVYRDLTTQENQSIVSRRPAVTSLTRFDPNQKRKLSRSRRTEHCFLPLIIECLFCLQTFVRVSSSTKLHMCTCMVAKERYKKKGDETCHSLY